MQKKNLILIEGIFNNNVPVISEAIAVSEKISNYDGARISALPTILANAGEKDGSREFKSAKNDFHYTMSEVLKKADEQGANLNCHIPIAGKQLLICYYHNPKICNDLQIKVFIQDLRRITQSN